LQVKSILAILNGQSVVLLAPTGSGKSAIYIVAIHLIRKHNPKGLLLLSLPVNEVMKEKNRDTMMKSVFVDMAGHAVADEGEAADGEFSVGLDEILTGEYPVIIGHAESWESKAGKKLVKKLRDERMIGLLAFDEVHYNIIWGLDSSQGKGFRPYMGTGPVSLKAKARKVPAIYMTATLTKAEVELMVVEFLIKNYVIIASCPVLPNHLFASVKRPEHGFGSYADGPNMEDMTNLMLEPWIEEVRQGLTPKRSLVFCKNVDDCGPISEELNAQLTDEEKTSADIMESVEENPPWVINWSEVGNVTKNVIGKKDNISMWITTCLMEMGLDIDDVQVVIMVRPPTRLHALIQSWGRAGRLQKDGTRKLVVCIVLWNNHDVASNIAGMTEEMAQFCKNKDGRCLRELLAEYFYCPETCLPAVEKRLCCSVCRAEESVN
jgi:superfamily II DNA helicase RecQ